MRSGLTCVWATSRWRDGCSFAAADARITIVRLDRRYDRFNHPSAARRATLETGAHAESAPSETRLFHLIDTGTELTPQRDLAKLVENRARRRMDQVIT